MAEGGVRVALLARAGKVRDQLHRALGEAGARIVVEGDPAELDPAEVATQSPTVFMVSLEPAIETALDRFDGLLAAPGVEVMFDDAEVTAALDGWDLNRWARNVASKLLGGDELPPAPEGSLALPDADLTPGPGLPPTPAELMDAARFEDYTGDSRLLADSVPASQTLATPEGDYEFGAGLDLDLGDLDFIRDASRAAPALGADVDAAADAGGAASDHGLDLDVDLDLGEAISFSSFSRESEPATGELDDDVAEMAARLDAFERADTRQAAMDPVFTTAAPGRSAAAGTSGGVEVIESVAVAEPARASVAAAIFDFSNLALAPLDGEAAVPTTPIAPKYANVKESLSPAPSLSLEGPAETRGAVLILAGMGGPDAVRQLLSSLPEKLAVPVILYQHLEVGKHERLVDQLAKISRLPVQLARDGSEPEAGKVTLLPAGMTAIASGDSLKFAAGSLSQLLTALPAADSMIVVLSGAETQLVPMILAVKDEGGLVMAQDPEVCFDAAASEAMQRQGAPVYPALGLARQIGLRWPS